VSGQHDDSNNYTGGKWYMTVNGQQFPTVPITASDGEVWRVATGAGSVSWDLQLVDDATHNPITLQLIAIDGVAVHLPQDTTPGAMIQMAGGRFKVVPCPDVNVIGSTVPVCVNEIVMMPSSRTEFWVTYRNASGRIVPPPSGASATLKMVGLTMGAATPGRQSILPRCCSTNPAAAVHQQPGRGRRRDRRGRPQPGQRHLHIPGSGSEHGCDARDRDRMHATAAGPWPAHLLRVLGRRHRRYFRARL
jgi:hypothetical protein